MRGVTKRHLVVKIHVPDGGKHAGTVEYAIDPDKVTEADREFARRLFHELSNHILNRKPPSPEKARP